MKKEIMELSEKCFTDYHPYDQLEAFYNEAEKRGFNAGIQAAAKVCEDNDHLANASHFAADIRALEKK